MPRYHSTRISGALKGIITAIMKGLLARDLYEDGSYFRPLSKQNKDFNAALDLINDPNATRLFCAEIPAN